MPRHLPAPSRPYRSMPLAYALITVLITLLPLLLWQWNPIFIRHTYSEAYKPFELLGFSAAAAVFGHTLWSLRKEQELTWGRLIPILVPAGLLLHFINLISEYSIPSWDYNCYLVAANALITGDNPYTLCYLYPPLLADMMAAIHPIIQQITFLSGGDSERSWDIVYYLFQCTQLFALALAYPLLYRFARRLGIQKTTAVLLIAALLLFNNPLLRNLRHTQVNLFILDLYLAALLLADRRAWLSGFSVAFGIHLKLYPAVLVVPWLLTRRWRPILFGAVGLILLILLSADWGQDWTVWQQFLTASRAFPPGDHFRDNSLYSIVSNSIGFYAVPAGMASGAFRAIVSIVVIGLSILLTGWVGWRLYQRRQLYMASGEQETDKYYFGQAIDALALGLMLAPRVWEHHYVLAIPIALWGIVTAGKKRPKLVITAVILMLALPTFDIYPLSHHRLAGLLLILYLTPPKNDLLKNTYTNRENTDNIL